MSKVRMGEKVSPLVVTILPGPSSTDCPLGKVRWNTPSRQSHLLNGCGVSGGGRMKFTNPCRAGNGGSDRGCSYGRSARAFRDLEKDRAIAQIHRARSLLETKNGVGTQARDGQVGEGQLTARLRAGADRGAVAHEIIHAQLVAAQLVAGATLHRSLSGSHALLLIERRWPE